MQEFPISIGARKKNGVLSAVVNCILVILIVIFVLEVTFFARFRRYYVVGDSMLPTLIGGEHDGNEVAAGGDYVYVDTMASPQRFDIVVINADNGSGKMTTIIKRVIAFAGESVELKRGQLYINGTLTEEPYVDPQNNDPDMPENTYAERVVDEGCVFVLGDNRNVSSDSRGPYGMIELGEIVGVVENWSLDMRWLFTPVSTFFDFTLPGIFSGCGR